MKTLLNNLEKENRFEFFSPFFRVFIGLYLLKKAFFIWKFQELLFKGDFLSPIPTSPILTILHIDAFWFRSHFEFFYGLYILLIFLFLFGIGKHITTLLLFLHLQVIYDLTWITLNGGDNLLEFVVFYFILIDSYSRFSLKSLTYKSENISKFSNFLSNLAGYCVCIHLCLVYFMSAVHKIHSDEWFHGVGLYYSIVAERFNGTPWNRSVVQNGTFVTLSNYATILIELAFPFLIWFKKSKHVMIVLAVMLHLGIAMFTMLYDFQFLFIILQGFFITNKEWHRIFISLNNKKTHLKARWSNS